VRTERPRILNLVALVLLSAGVGIFLQGAAFWAGALLVSAATAYGAFALMADLDPRGVPVESLATPAAAAFATVGLAHLAGAALVALPVLAAGGALVALTLLLEMRLLGPADSADPHRQQQLLVLTVLLAFLCFTSVAGAVHGGLAGEPGTAGSSLGVQEGSLLVLAVADGLVAFVLGYRLAALRSPSIREVSRAAGTFGVVVAASAALIRAIALPRLLGPAVLAAVFYLWSAYRSASGLERRSAAWLWEYLALAGAAALAVAWNLLLR
jgi:hypothetical protein